MARLNLFQVDLNGSWAHGSWLIAAKDADHANEVVESHRQDGRYEGWDFDKPVQVPGTITKVEPGIIHRHEYCE